MQVYEIKSRFSDEVLFSCEAGSLKECLEKAVKEGANLENAYFKGANLGGVFRFY